MKKIHFVSIPNECPNKWRENTSDIAKVTCKTCLNFIKRNGLVPREFFGDHPEFTLVKIDRFNNAYFTCPCCGKVNIHQGVAGLKTSMCRCFKSYYLKA